MKIELRKITYSAALSQETSAYTADLYVDGKLTAHISNQGHGGCDSQYPAKGKTHADVERVAAFIKSTYPKKDTGMMLEGKPFIMEQDLESVCGDLLTEYLVSRDLTRLLKRTIAFYSPTEKTVRSYKGKIEGERRAHLVTETIRKYPDAKILNNLPFAEALELYRATP